MLRKLWSPPRRSFPKRPFLLLLVGILAAAVVATVIQVRPQAHADTINDVQVTQHNADASIKAGTTATCVITDTATLQGDENRVSEFIKSASKSALDLGMKVTTDGGNTGPGLTSTNLILSYEIELTQYAIAPESCSTEKTVDAHRGRKAMELPDWARGLVASTAAIAVYLAVAFAVVTVFGFLAPEFAAYAELIGGCIAGFAASFVSNIINRVPRAANLTASAVWCVAGALLNLTIGTIRQEILEGLRDHISNDLASVVGEGVSRGAGHAEEMTHSVRGVTGELADALAEVH